MISIHEINWFKEHIPGIRIFGAKGNIRTVKSAVLVFSFMNRGMELYATKTVQLVINRYRKQRLLFLGN